MNAQTAINFDAPDRVDIDVIDDPKLGYCKVYRWTKAQRRKLEQYQRTVDHSGPGTYINGEPMNR